MARRYVNPAKSVALVTEDMLLGAKQRVDEAHSQLEAAEQADPSAPGWDEQYTTALGALRGAERRAEVLSAVRASQLERSGKRADTVTGAKKELSAIAAALAVSRDQVAAAAAAHLQALAALSAAAAAHNEGLAAGRARLAGMGLAARDDLLAEGAEHPEGTIDRGVRVGGIDWTPVPAAGVAAHALRQVLDAVPGFRGPFAATKYTWRPHEVESRPDGLKVPTAKDAGVALPPAPVPPVMPARADLRDLMPSSPDGDFSAYRRDVRTVAT